MLLEYGCEVQSDKMNGRHYTAEESQTVRMSARNGLYLEKLTISQLATFFRFLGTTEFVTLSTVVSLELVEGTPLSDIPLPDDVF